MRRLEFPRPLKSRRDTELFDGQPPRHLGSYARSVPFRPQLSSRIAAAFNASYGGFVMDLKLPNLGEGADSGTVVNLFVKEGDQVTKDQPILELEIEKAVATIPSTAAGR